MKLPAGNGSGVPARAEPLRRSVGLSVFQPEAPDLATGAASGVAPARGWLEGGWAILDGAGLVHEVNEPLCQWLEKPPGEIAGLSFWAMLTGHCAEWSDALVDLKRGSEPFAEVQLQRSSPGNAAPAWYRLEVARHGGSAFVRMNSMLPPRAALEEATWDEYLRTESAQREMFVRLLRAESQLHNLTERWPGVIFSQRADFTFRFVSPKIEELTGVPVAEWQSRSQRFWQCVHENDADELRARLKQAHETRQPVTTTFRVRHAQTGRVAYVMEHRHAMVSAGGLLFGYEGVWLDVTRQTIAEKRLSSAAWKETLSVVTMGLAHDFGNVMAGIHALSESFIAQVDEKHPFHEGLGLIQRNSQQASQLVHRIVNLHQGKTGECDYHNLNELASDAADLVRKIIPRRVQFELTQTDASLPVYLDAVEFRQVVINLVLNAIDAMPRAGTLAIHTELREGAATPVHCHGRVPRGPAVVLRVRDTGAGISPRHLDCVFDPFFTTKALSKGSGLGLYNARLFVEKHRGAISVESTEGAGTEFQLWLPVADFTESERERKTDTSLYRRSLLLVGRYAEVLDSTAEFLRANNYHVLAVLTPESAAESLESPNYNFSAVMALAEPNDAALLTWLTGLRSGHSQLKLFLKAVGSHQDDFSAAALAQTDVFLPTDLPPPGLLEKLSGAFGA